MRPSEPLIVAGCVYGLTILTNKIVIRLRFIIEHGISQIGYGFCWILALKLFVSTPNPRNMVPFSHLLVAILITTTRDTNLDFENRIVGVPGVRNQVWGISANRADEYLVFHLGPQH